MIPPTTCFCTSTALLFQAISFHSGISMASSKNAVLAFTADRQLT